MIFYLSYRWKRREKADREYGEFTMTHDSLRRKTNFSQVILPYATETNFNYRNEL
ncbi:hypothetical protein H6G17_22105 [Chroococcidiopsis sp. FACHB-1243]|uniref:hypothetical protein n=1 Tax=Chroococcidiopsis sp. [FACHB-1243] TaxID=2692781 RepID=UPI00177EA90D|nr:hypothetical protein [Chroococcidiopsis sp. [FACHB-1243]]MBD2308170.1 hypothetical protein [Chroococcidiopsis sp. [FACHB-1243]]